MPTIIATPGAANANSYTTLAEATTYFTTRLPLSGWDDADDQSVLLIMATRVIESAFAAALKILIPEQGGVAAYYRVTRAWTGTPASTTQALSWPRIGMFDLNGVAIPTNVIPQDLKDAVSELAGQLGVADRTLDNDVIIQGLTSVKAGSVALTFKQNFLPQVIPDAVLNMLVPSWLTDELVLPAFPALFDVIS